jgi:hypothetical protein
MAVYKAYKKSAFILFWTLLKNKLSMKSTLGKHKQIRQVKHPYYAHSWFSVRNGSGKILMYLSYVLINQVMYIIFISAVFLEKMFVVVAKSLFTQYII